MIRHPDGSKFGSLTGYEAIVLVFDATREDSWHAVSTWAVANADALQHTEITLVCGCVCVLVQPRVEGLSTQKATHPGITRMSWRHAVHGHHTGGCQQV